LFGPAEAQMQGGGRGVRPHVKKVRLRATGRGTAIKQNLAQNRADQIIAVSRLVLASLASVAVAIDAPSPIKNASIVAAMLLVYTAAATIFCVVVLQRSRLAPPIGHWSHPVDIAIMGALTYLTNGSSTPFFPFYMFVTLAATLKWNARGAAWTTLVIVMLFVATSFAQPAGLETGDDGRLRFAIRLGQVGVVGALLIFMGGQRERAWRELVKLARPIRATPGSMQDSINLCLVHACEFFGTDRAILLCEDDDSRWSAITAGPASTTIGPVPLSNPAPVATDAAGSAFDFIAGAQTCRFYDSSEMLQVIPRSLLSADVARDLAVTEAAVVAINSSSVAGWLIIPKRPIEDDLYLALALSTQIAAALDQAATILRLQAAAASAERERLAYDLHDGTLQFMTGLALQLKVIEKLSRDNPGGIAARTAMLLEALRIEHRQLRGFIEGERHGGLPESAASSITDLAGRLANHWNIVIDVIGDNAAPQSIVTDIQQIIREAVANAVRHGKATKIRMETRHHGSSYDLVIADNGTGFANPGRHSRKDLRNMGIGPRSILARIDQLGGSIVIDTNRSGAAIEITVPTKDLHFS